MNWWINALTVIALVILEMSQVHASESDFPAGLARVMSVYQNRPNNEKVLVAGYGAIIRLVEVLPNGRRQSQYVLQTVSHLSQGSYDVGHLSDPTPVDRKRKPIPKLLIQFYLDQNVKSWGHHQWAPLEEEFKSVVGDKSVSPLIASTYFESFRDIDLFVLDLSVTGLQQIPVAATWYVQRDPRTGRPQFVKQEVTKLQLKPGWRWSWFSRTLALPCSDKYPTCLPQRQLSNTGSSPRGLLAQRLLRDGFIQGEYDRWIPVMTDPGMSGLPVYSFEEAGTAKEIVGLVSGSSPQTRDTWLSHFDPLEQFDRWKSEVQGFAPKHLFLTYGFGDLIWIMENYSLSRVGQNGAGIRYQESRIQTEVSEAPGVSSDLRCSHGGGFRQDNGGGFRLDNGDVDQNCGPGSLLRGRSMITQRPGERPASTAFMVMDHAALTLLFPPTATGLGYSYLQSQLAAGEEMAGVPQDDRIKSELFDIAPTGQFRIPLKADVFNRSAEALYQSKDQATWSSKLEGLVLEKFPDGSVRMEETGGHVRMKPQYQNGAVAQIEVEVQTTDRGSFRTTVDFLRADTSKSVANFEQAVTWNGQAAKMNLAGLLMQNPDYIDMPDLDISLQKHTTGFEATYHASRGDQDLRTLFTVVQGTKVYYFTSRWEASIPTKND